MERAILCSLVLTLVFLQQIKSDNVNGELLLVQIVHRHGDRTPVFIDPNYAAQWATVAPPGQLTTIGMAQHQAFGAMLRQQYVVEEPFLDYNYTNEHVHVRSTDFDRTLMSVQSLLSQLYPGAFVPIHTVPNSEDFLLQPIDTCPSYTSQATVLQSLNDQNILANYATLLNQTLFATGLYANNQLTGPSSTMITAYDNFVCMTAHGFAPTQLYTDISSDLHDQVKHLWYTQYVDPTPATDPRGPMGAMMLQTIYQNMIDVSTAPPSNGVGASGYATLSDETSSSFTATPSSPHHSSAAHSHFHTVKGEDIPSELHIPVDHDAVKPQGTGTSTQADPLRLFIYSAHDTTLLALFTALESITSNDDNKITPPYASSVVFELRKTAGGVLNVLAYFGYPERNEAFPATTRFGWNYVQDVLPLMCPTALSPCKLSDWGTHIAPLTANVGATQSGCCQIMPAFSQLNCNQWTTPATQLDSDCMKYRSACPVSSCAGSSGSVLDEATMSCVVPAALAEQGSVAHKYKDYTIGLAVVSILLFLGLLGSVLYFRNKLHLTSYGNLQQRMSHAQFV